MLSLPFKNIFVLVGMQHLTQLFGSHDSMAMDILYWAIGRHSGQSVLAFFRGNPMGKWVYQIKNVKESLCL